LFQTAVANPVAVAIVVHETSLTSNAATFTINPPLQAIQPILPSGTLNQPYSAYLITGGTPPFPAGGPPHPPLDPPPHPRRTPPPPRGGRAGGNPPRRSHGATRERHHHR